MVVGKITLVGGQTFENAEVDTGSKEELIDSIIRGKLIAIKVDGKNVYLNAEQIKTLED